MQLFPNRYVFVVLQQEQEAWNLMRVSNFDYNLRNLLRLLFLFWKKRLRHSVHSSFGDFLSEGPGLDLSKTML